MRAILTLIIFIGIGFTTASAQQKSKVTKQEVENIFTKVENEAHTDQNAWHRYLNKNLKLTDTANSGVPPGCYTIIVSFVVDIYGTITDVIAVNDPGYGLGGMVVMVIRNYKGKWTPASQCGRLVKSYKKQPVIVTIQSE